MKWLKFLFAVFVVFNFARPTAFAAAVSGTVNFAGTPPQREVLAMTADPVCAQGHTAAALSEQVVVNENGTLSNVVVYVKEGLGEEDFEAPKDAAVLDQTACVYHPHVLAVQTQQPIELVNSDDTLHNVHALAQVNKSFNLAMPFKGMKLKKSFDQPEIVKVKCDVHPWMVSYIAVFGHPFFNVTGEAGNFEINGLPAGDYVIEAWHETYGTAREEVSVDEGGTAQIQFTFSA